MTPKKATLDSLRTHSRFVSFQHIALKFQHSLSAVTLGIYLCGRIDPAGFQQLKSEYASIPPLHADISALLHVYCTWRPHAQIAHAISSFYSKRVYYA
jgi:hypothetical protein